MRAGGHARLPRSLHLITAAPIEGGASRVLTGAGRTGGPIGCVGRQHSRANTTCPFLCQLLNFLTAYGLGGRNMPPHAGQEMIRQVKETTVMMMPRFR